MDSHDDSDLPPDSRDPESVSDSESENESERIQHTPLHTMSEGGPEDSRELLLQPNQPRLKSFPPKQFGKKKLNIGHSIRNGLIMRSGLHGCTGTVKQKNPTALCAEISTC